LVVLLVVGGITAGCGVKGHSSGAPFIFVNEEKTTVSPSGEFDLYWSRNGGGDRFTVFMINSRKEPETGVRNFFPDYGFPPGETFVLAWDQTNRAWLLQNKTVRRWSLNGKEWKLTEFADGANDPETKTFLAWVKTLPPPAPHSSR